MSSKIMSWDRKEVSLLIKTYFDIKNSPSEKDRLISELSESLRRYAIKLGNEIDDRHRNINGITMCLQMIGSLVTGKGLKPTRLQREVYQLYLNNPEDFNRLVAEARQIIANGDMEALTINSFDEWLAENSSEIDVDDTVRLIKDANSIMRNYRITKKDIMRISSPLELKKIVERFIGYSVIKIKHRKNLPSMEKALMLLINYREAILEKVSETHNTENNHVESVIETSSKNDVQLKIFENTPVQVREDTSKEAFLSWLQKRKSLSIASSRSYASAIKNCEQFSDEHSLGLSFYGNSDYNIIANNVSILLSNSDFCKLNICQHNRLSVSLKHFLGFVKDKVDVPTELIVSQSKSKPKVDKNKYTEGITKILFGHYKYGFRFESAIEIMRFRQFAENEEIDLPESDEALKQSIIKSGFVIEDKVYIIESESISELSIMFDMIHGSGINVVFYEPFMEKHSEWLTENHIVSIEILKKLIQDNFSKIRCGKNFLAFDSKTTESDAVIAELRRIWEDSPIMSIGRMDELLEYIPEENIKRCCYANAAISWSHDDFFMLLDKFIITDEQIAEIKSFAREKCESDGYLSINDIPMEQIEEENYEVSPTAVSSAIYKLALQDEFELTGKILTNGSSSIDIVSLLKKYCVNKDECSYDEVAEKVVEITGSSNRRAAFQALYDTMVRTDSNRFVADRHVKFDVGAIDDILGPFVSNGYISIKGITTFAMFPVCGQIWNHFLLESYCYKYSEKYSLNCLNFNDKNCGIIVEKSLNRSYDELLAETAANADIELTEEAVGTYLFDNGYISKSKSSNIMTIVANAAQIREGK